MLLFDLNDFKRVNESYGHDVGDDVLRLTATTVGRALRERDVLLSVGWRGVSGAAALNAAQTVEVLMDASKCALQPLTPWPDD